MLGLIPVVLLIAAACGGFYYWLSRRGLAAEERANPQDRGRLSLMTEGVAYFGATLVLAGGGVAVGQASRGFTDWGHVGIFASTALFFLAAGLAVLRISEPPIDRMIGVVWFLSAGCAGAAAGIAARDGFGASGGVTAFVIGIAISVYSATLWLVRKRELQLVALFAGLTIAVCAAIITIAGDAGPRLAVALGLWALGIGWVIVGRQYPQPLWSTMPLAIVIALIGPSVAVWSHGWVFAIGVLTAAVAMAVSVRVRSTTLLVAGTLTLFGYVGAAVARYYHQSLGLPATLAICGVLFVGLAVIVARVRSATGRGQADRAGPSVRAHRAERTPSGLRSAQRDLDHSTVRPQLSGIQSEPIKPEPADLEPAERADPEPAELERPEFAPDHARATTAHATTLHGRLDGSESPALVLPKAS
jgi:hypothetical protein